MLKMITLGAILILAATLSAQAQTTAPRSAAAPRAAAPAAPGGAAAASSGAAASTPSGAAPGQFPSEQAAKAHCPGDAIVWANLGGSKAYHLSGDRYYGKTKHGAFMCQKEADQAGYHAAGRRAGKAAAKSTGAKSTH